MSRRAPHPLILFFFGLLGLALFASALYLAYSRDALEERRAMLVSRMVQDLSSDRCSQRPTHLSEGSGEFLDLASKSVGDLLLRMDRWPATSGPSKRASFLSGEADVSTLGEGDVWALDQTRIQRDGFLAATRAPELCVNRDLAVSQTKLWTASQKLLALEALDIALLANKGASGPSLGRCAGALALERDLLLSLDPIAWAVVKASSEELHQACSLAIAEARVGPQDWETLRAMLLSIQTPLPTDSDLLRASRRRIELVFAPVIFSREDLTLLPGGGPEQGAPANPFLELVDRKQRTPALVLAGLERYFEAVDAALAALESEQDLDGALSPYREGLWFKLLWADSMEEVLGTSASLRSDLGSLDGAAFDRVASLRP